MYIFESCNEKYKYVLHVVTSFTANAEKKIQIDTRI